MVILVSLLRRLPDLSHEQFVHHHREHHAPLFVSLPAVGRYVRRYVVEHPRPIAAPGVPETSFDAIVRQWFDSTDDIGALLASEDYREQVLPDERRFIDATRSEFYFAHEQVLLGEQSPPAQPL